MAFVVEDGTGKEDSNSYETIAEFKAYLADYNITLTETDEVIQPWLIEATRYADSRYLYAGYKNSEDQALEFPRGAFCDNRGKLYDNDVIPLYLKNAVSELAYFIKNNGTLTPDITCSGIKSKKIGPVSVTYEDQTSRAIEPFCSKAELWFAKITKDNSAEVIPV